MRDIYTIRQAQASDGASIRDFLAMNGQNANIAVDADSRFLLAQTSGDTIGVIGAELNFPCALIRSAGVLQRFRKYGIGTHLFCELTQALREEGITDLYLFSKGGGSYWINKGFSHCSIETIMNRLSVAKQVKGYIDDGSIWTDVAWHREIDSCSTHYELSDDEFQLAFEQCTLHASLFTHEAHIRLAWIHIKRQGLPDALSTITSQLAAFTKANGVASKYNEPLTLAAIHIIADLMKTTNAGSFRDFMAENPRLAVDFKEMLKNYLNKPLI